MGAEDGAQTGTTTAVLEKEKSVDKQKNVKAELLRLGQEFATWLYDNSKNDRQDVGDIIDMMCEKFRTRFVPAMMNAIAGKGETALGYFRASLEVQALPNLGLTMLCEMLNLFLRAPLKMGRLFSLDNLSVFLMRYASRLKRKIHLSAVYVFKL